MMIRLSLSRSSAIALSRYNCTNRARGIKLLHRDRIITRDRAYKETCTLSLRDPSFVAHSGSTNGTTPSNVPRLIFVSHSNDSALPSTFCFVIASSGARASASVDAGGGDIKVLHPDTEIRQKRVPAFTDARASS